MAHFIRNCGPVAAAVLFGALALGQPRLAAQNRPTIIRGGVAETPRVGGPEKAVYTVQGRVIAFQPDTRRLRIRTVEGSELVLRAAVEKIIDNDGKELALAKLVEGAPVTVLYEMQPVAITIRTGPPVELIPEASPVRAATPVRGRFVRALGPDSFLITSADGKEIKASVADRAVVRLSGKDVELTDFREGTDVVIFAEISDGKYLVRRLENSEPRPAAAAATGATGRLHGRIFEADRFQPDIEVILRTDAGIDVANTITQKNGVFAFQNVKPGVYRIFSHKPITKTAVEERVTVEPNKDKAVFLELSR